MSLKRTYIYMMGLGLMGVVVLLAGLATGYTPIGWIDIIQALLGGEVEKGNVIWDLRLPRVLLAFCAGGVLTLGGFYMQSLIRNPLADPYIMGVTAGAGLGVNLLILGLIPITAYTIFTYPLFAGVGALSSLLLVVLMGFRAMFEDSARLLIAGVAVASIYTAATGVMIYMLAEDDQVRRIVFWAFGSLAYAQWEDVYVSGILLALGLGFGWIYARRLDLLLLGDRQAHTLGMRVHRVKWGVLIVCSLMVGGTVAFTGPIGFVGMMIPHFSRALWGSQHRKVLGPGVLLGGIYLCACDILSRWLLPYAGLPIGIVTAILGVPFFLYLLFSRNKYL